MNLSGICDESLNNFIFHGQTIQGKIILIIKGNFYYYQNILFIKILMEIMKENTKDQNIY
jgi:hypothetical protein